MGEYIALTPGRPMQGLRGIGNLNLTQRPLVRLPDGSHATVRSITITDDNGAVLIPTAIGGRIVSNADAIKHYHMTGEHLGRFDNESNANGYAEQLHKQQSKLYNLDRPRHEGMDAIRTVALRRAMRKFGL